MSTKDNKDCTIELRFDSKEDAKAFLVDWLDCGGEQRSGFLTDFEKSDDWTKTEPPKWLKLVRVEFEEEDEDDEEDEEEIV